MKNEFVRNILDQLFGPKEPVESLNGSLVRSASFKKGFAEWKAHANFVETFAILHSLFSRVAIDGGHHPAFHVFSSPQANGFYFNSNVHFDFDLYPYIFDSFRGRVLDFGYTLYTSDRRYIEVPLGIQQIDRHYLKPKNSKRSDGLLDQKFGNILIELYALDGVPQYLKVLSTVYAGKNYAEPLGFVSFGQELLGPA